MAREPSQSVLASPVPTLEALHPELHLLALLLLSPSINPFWHLGNRIWKWKLGECQSVMGEGPANLISHLGGPRPWY